MTNPSIQQDEVFRSGEGDAWFRRNAASLDAHAGHDWILDSLSRLQGREQIRTVCEVGCASAWRLARLPEVLPHTTRRAGFDLSEDAVRHGRARDPALDLRFGAASAPPFDEQFDLVIVSFVLHWIDRSLFTRSLAAIDALVAPGGFLAVADFLPDSPCRRRYHHRDDVALYTYKQDYAAAFTATNLYREVSRSVFHHGDTQGALQAAADGERASCVLLHKPVNAYPER
jgi:SAM-dependent methyltransferase